MSIVSSSDASLRDLARELGGLGRDDEACSASYLNRPLNQIFRD
ncbi:MAG: hypothetical protein JWO51_924 [Rhodospirillales bacterium]|nr:hypothetical protein [Rhodospirillales bacterium]